MKVPYHLMIKFNYPAYSEPELDDNDIESIYNILTEMISDIPVFITSITVIGGKSLSFGLRHTMLDEFDDATLLNLVKTTNTIIRGPKAYYDVCFDGASLNVTYSTMDAGLKLCETK